MHVKKCHHSLSAQLQLISAHALPIDACRLILERNGSSVRVVRAVVPLITRQLWPLMHSALLAPDMVRVWRILCQTALVNDHWWHAECRIDVLAMVTARHVSAACDLPGEWVVSPLEPLVARFFAALCGRLLKLTSVFCHIFLTVDIRRSVFYSTRKSDGGRRWQGCR